MPEMSVGQLLDIGCQVRWCPNIATVTQFGQAVGQCWSNTQYNLPKSAACRLTFWWRLSNIGTLLAQPVFLFAMFCHLWPARQNYVLPTKFCQRDTLPSRLTLLFICLKHCFVLSEYNWTIYYKQFKFSTCI